MKIHFFGKIDHLTIGSKMNKLFLIITLILSSQTYGASYYDFIFKGSTPDSKISKSILRKLKRTDIKRENIDVLDIATPSSSLRGKTIVIDPGHLGGKLAQAEWKFVRLNGASQAHQHTQFLSEGDLNLEIALLTAEKLRDRGAKVILTRNKLEESALGPFLNWLNSSREVSKSIELRLVNTEKKKQAGARQWYNQEITKARKLLKSKPNALEIIDQLALSDRKILSNAFVRLYLTSERVARAEKINSINPDMTIMIHLNVDEEDALRDDFTHVGTHKNTVMAFTPGGYMYGEDRSEHSRQTIKYLSENQKIFEKSVSLCQLFVDELSNELNIPKAISSDAKYLTNNTISIADLLGSSFDGLFARNLTMTGYVKGVQCFTESLYYDNVNEHQMLNQRGFINEENIETSERINQIANAHAEAALKYFSL
jgi:N-acetylmuramoyl-L-alanine amidase